MLHYHSFSTLMRAALASAFFTFSWISFSSAASASSRRRASSSDIR